MPGLAWSARPASRRGVRTVLRWPSSSRITSRAWGRRCARWRRPERADSRALPGHRVRHRRRAAPRPKSAGPILQTTPSPW